MRTNQRTCPPIMLVVTLACTFATGCDDKTPPLPTVPPVAPPAPPSPPPPPPPPPPVAPAPPPVGTGKLVIVKATWGVLYGGSAENIKDVTKQIRDMVKEDSLSLIPSPELLGETALGTHKDLKIEYKKGKVAAKLVVGEGEPLTIAIDEKPERVRLVVTKAVYGDLNSKEQLDVTARVAPKVRGNTLSIAGYNGIFGDPAIGKDKQFRVDYKLDGKAETKTVGERERLTLSAPKP